MGTPGVLYFPGPETTCFMIDDASEAGVFRAVVESAQPVQLSASATQSGSLLTRSATVPFFVVNIFSMIAGIIRCDFGDNSSLK